MHSLDPIDPPYQASVAAALKGYPKGEDGYLLKLFRVFAQSLRFLSGKGPVNLLDAESPLALRTREMIILRVTAHYGCEYEWGVHVAVFAAQAGFIDEEIAALYSGGADASCWTAEEALLIKCVDAMLAHGRLKADQRTLFQATWTAEQQLEILALCSNYHLVSMVANTANLAPEPFATRFPA